MIVLLPPSEGKTAPTRGRAMREGDLGFAELAPARERVLDALVALCEDDAAKAAEVLDVPPTRPDLVDLNAALRTAPTARAESVYTGVLYEALDAGSLSPAARRRAASRVAVVSALFGLVRLGDRIPAYRLSGGATLPGLGAVAGVWRECLGDAVLAARGRGLLVDLRSSAYTAFWRPGPAEAERTATVRVLHERDGIRSVVSHFNKATKGRIVRALLEAGSDPTTPEALAATLRDLGWVVETEAGRTGTRLDVVVSDL